MKVQFSATLCSALATVAHHISTEPTHPDDLTAFVAHYLIPLDNQVNILLALERFLGALLQRLYFVL